MAIGPVLFLEFTWLLLLAVTARTAVRQLFGPVFLYEGIRLGRRKTTFVLRGVYVGFMMGLLGLMYLSWHESISYRSGNNFGRTTVRPNELAEFATQFFITFELFQFFIVILLTPAYVAGCIADEKERKTLEFLLATDLRNHEILFGKLAARVAGILMYILAGLPILGFLQLFGGIDPELLLIATLVTAVTVIGLSALGIYFSTMQARPRDAIGLTYMTAAGYIVASFIMSSILAGLSLSGTGGTLLGFPLAELPLMELAEWLSAGNPGFGVFMIFAGPGGRGPNLNALPDYLFRFLVFWAVASVLLLLLSAIRLRAAALAVPQRATRHPARQPARSRPIVGEDAMFWKEVFTENHRRRGCAGRFFSVIWFGLIFFVPVLMICSFFGDLFPLYLDLFGGYRINRPFDHRWNDFVEGMNVWVRVTTGLLSGVLFMAAAVRGASCVTAERDRDTWDSLISTPLKTRELLFGKWWGVILGLRANYTVLLLIWATGLAIGAIPVFMLPVLILATMVYVSAFAWLGVYFSAISRSTAIATVRAILTAFFLNGGFWLVLGLCCVIPLELLFRGVNAADGLDNLGLFLLGSTPPFVMGWLPLHEFGRADLEPFTDRYNGGGIGILAPIFGMLVWMMLLGMFQVLAWNAFKKAALRVEYEHRPTPGQPRTPPNSSN